MYRLAFMILLSAALSCAWTAAGQEEKPKVDGDWTLKMPGPGGEEVSIDFTLKTEGDALTGTFQFPGRVVKIEEGKQSDATLSWTLKQDRPSGGTMVYKMTGKLDGNKIAGTTSADMDGNPVEMPWTAERKK